MEQVQDRGSIPGGPPQGCLLFTYLLLFIYISTRQRLNSGGPSARLFVIYIFIIIYIYKYKTEAQFRGALRKVLHTHTHTHKHTHTHIHRTQMTWRCYIATPCSYTTENATFRWRRTSSNGYYRSTLSTLRPWLTTPICAGIS